MNVRLAAPGGVIEAEFRADSDGTDAEFYLYEAELITPDGCRHKIDEGDLQDYGRMRVYRTTEKFQSLLDALNELAADRQPAWARE